MNNISYNAKSIKTLKTIEAIRKHPGMYIGMTGEEGILHLLQEVMSNSIDEFLNGHGSYVAININTKLNQVTVADDGRGIPFGKMDDGEEAIISIATKLHSGGKFSKPGEGGYNVSGGLHGVGLTATNALSEQMQIVSTRDKKIATVLFEKGIVQKLTIDDCPNNNRGTAINFIPDSSIFENAKFNIAEVEKRIELMSFLTTGLKFIFTVDGVEKIYRSNNGIKDLLNSKIKKEDIASKLYYTRNLDNEGCETEVAFYFTKNKSFNFLAFTNNILNIEGGTHLTGFKTAFTNKIKKLAKSKLKGLENKIDDISGEMLQRGVFVVISHKMQETPTFKSQTKEKLISPSARGPVSNTTGALIETISDKDLKFLIEKALLEKKAEDTAKRVRESALKIKSGGKNLSRLDKPTKLKDCVVTGTGELFLVEGDSAGGTAKQAADSQFQAVLPLRGKVLNTFDKELDKAIENREIKDIMNTLGCGVGQKFNIRNLNYKKIILLADADVDGQHINVLLLTLFVKFFPKLIENGNIYIGVPPLYSIKKGNKIQYIYNKSDLPQTGNYQRYKGLGEMNVSQLKETIFDVENRKLVQLTMENVENTLEFFSQIMGNNSSTKFDYIVKNSKLMEEQNGQ